MGKNWEYAAGVLWPVLARAAHSHEKLTYGELAPLINTNPLSVRNALGPILFYCLENKLPPLTVVAVGKNSGLPGSGFIAWDTDDLGIAYKQVYAFNWQAVENPFIGFGEADTTETLAQALLNSPEQAEEVYRQVKVRGTAQRIFRLALLEAYEYRCAVCRLSFEEALEAAHIQRWSECGNALRMSPKNGILLCSNHHKLFDCGYISITPDFAITYEDPGFDPEDYSYADEQATLSISGKKLFLPSEESLRPDVELFKLRGVD